jgi:hypothetical protein
MNLNQVHDCNDCDAEVGEKLTAAERLALRC